MEYASRVGLTFEPDIYDRCIPSESRGVHIHIRVFPVILTIVIPRLVLTLFSPPRSIRVLRKGAR